MKVILRKVCLILFFGFVLVVDAFSQITTSLSAGLPAKKTYDSFNTDTIYSAKRIKEEDKMYQISVWRRIDLREKNNVSFYGSGDSKENGIINQIYKAVKKNELEVFADESFSKPLSIPKFDSLFWVTDNGDSIFVKQLYYLDFKEDFVFDKLHSRFTFDIKYLSLIMPAEINGAGIKIIGYIRYKDFIKYFANHPDARWINFDNISKNMTYDKAFESRFFRSVITKYTNRDDKFIVDLVENKIPKESPEVKKMQAYLDALAYEYNLLEIESSVWEW
ncbi:MAG: gliding motility protein GldN [Bacteroidota bacterium]